MIVKYKFRNQEQLYFVTLGGLIRWFDKSRVRPALASAAYSRQSRGGAEVYILEELYSFYNTTPAGVSEVMRNINYEMELDVQNQTNAEDRGDFGEAESWRRRAMIQNEIYYQELNKLRIAQDEDK